MEILKQKNNMPLEVEKQIISFYALTNGYADDIDVEDVRNFEEELLLSMENTSDILKQIRENKAITSELEEEIMILLKHFKNDFVHQKELIWLQI